MTEVVYNINNKKFNCIDYGSKDNNCLFYVLNSIIGNLYDNVNDLKITLRSYKSEDLLKINSDCKFTINDFEQCKNDTLGNIRDIYAFINMNKRIKLIIHELYYVDTSPNYLGYQSFGNGKNEYHILHIYNHFIKINSIDFI